MGIKIYLYKKYILQLRQTLMASLSMQIASLEILQRRSKKLLDGG